MAARPGAGRGAGHDRLRPEGRADRRRQPAHHARGAAQAALARQPRVRARGHEILYPPVARMLLLLFIAVFAIYLRFELPQVFRDNAMLAMFALLTAVTFGVAELLVSVFRLPEYAVPLARPAGRGVAAREAPGAGVHAAAGGRGQRRRRVPPAFVPVAAMGGVTAVYSVARLRHRWHFARPRVAIAIANASPRSWLGTWRARRRGAAARRGWGRSTRSCRCGVPR